ncbi:MAG: carbohydrate ABC transporter permease, partial [Ruminiclostridium sp.]
AILRKYIYGKKFFKTVFFIPNIISGVAIGLLWIFILHPNFGMVNSFLRLVGLGSFTHTWLAEKDTALICVVAAVCWQYIGYHMIIFLCAMEDISDSIIEAAAIDGATPFKLFWNIILPIIVPIVKIDAVLIATGSLRMFDMIFIMTEGGPNHATEVIATHMYTRSFKGMQFGYGSSMSVILMILCVAVTVLLNKAFKKAEENVQ